MGKRVTLNPLTNARRTANSSGGSGGDLTNRVEILETKVAGLEEYSTLETSTGKEWIDGKTIYRKVIDFENGVTLDSNNWLDTYLFFDDLVDTLVSAIGFYKGDHGGAGNDYENLPIGVRISNYGTQTVQAIAPLPFKLDRLVLEYTKLFEE